MKVLNLNGPKGEMSNPWHMQIINRRRWGLISLVAGLGLVVVGAGRLIETTSQYQATAEIRVCWELMELAPCVSTRPTVSTRPISVGESIISSIQSEAVRERCARNLNLGASWSQTRSEKSLAVAALRRQIIVTFADRRPGELIAITAAGATPTQAAQLANGVAEAYRELRIESMSRSMVAEIRALETERNKLERQAQSLPAGAQRRHLETLCERFTAQIRFRENRLNSSGFQIWSPVVITKRATESSARTREFSRGDLMLFATGLVFTGCGLGMIVSRRKPTSEQAG